MKTLDKNRKEIKELIDKNDLDGLKKRFVRMSKKNLQTIMDEACEAKSADIVAWLMSYANPDTQFIYSEAFFWAAMNKNVLIAKILLPWATREDTDDALFRAAVHNSREIIYLLINEANLGINPNNFSNTTNEGFLYLNQLLKSQQDKTELSKILITENKLRSKKII